MSTRGTKAFIFTFMIFFVTTVSLAPINRDMTIVRDDEAFFVANNLLAYINSILELSKIYKYEIRNTEIFTFEDLSFCYIYHLRPKGHIILSAYKELSPIRSFSTDSDFIMNKRGYERLVTDEIREEIEFIRKAPDTDYLIFSKITQNKKCWEFWLNKTHEIKDFSFNLEKSDHDENTANDINLNQKNFSVYQFDNLNIQQDQISEKSIQDIQVEKYIQYLHRKFRKRINESEIKQYNYENRPKNAILSLLSNTVSTHEDYLGNFIISGAIQNDGTSASVFTKVQIQLYDKNNNLLGSDYSYSSGGTNIKLSSGTYTNALLGGEIGFFKVWSSYKFSQIDHWEISIFWDEYSFSSCNSAVGFDGNLNFSSEYFGDLKIIGKIKNSSPYYENGFIEVCFAFFDFEGKVMDVDSTFVASEILNSWDGTKSGTVIYPGQSLPFTLHASVRESEYSSYEYFFEWVESGSQNSESHSNITLPYASRGQTASTYEPRNITNKKILNNSLSQPLDIIFSAPRLFAVEAAPGYITGGDFNKDGRPDLLVLGLLYGSGNLLLSNSEGGYDVQRSIQYAEATVGATADFNKDGWLDYVYTGNTGVIVAINQQGQSWAKQEFFLGGGAFITISGGFQGLCVADFDTDGYSEIAAVFYNWAQESQSVYIVQNNAGVLSEDPTSYPLVLGPSLKDLRSAAVGDFNGDGYKDLVATFTDDKQLSVLLNNGSGGFQSPKLISLDCQAWMVVANDLNGDGKTDLVVGSQVDKKVVVLKSNGDGSFSKTNEMNLADELYSVNIADLDGDGHADIFSNSKDDLFTSWRNDGKGIFAKIQTINFGPFSTGYGLMAFRSYLNFFPADFNKDGVIDLAAIFTGNQIGIIYGNGDGTFPVAQSLVRTGELHSIVDYNRDGWDDLVTFDRWGGKFSVSRNQKDGTFLDFLEPAVQPVTAIQADLGYTFETFKMIDFDNDGDLDCAMSWTLDSQNDFVSILRNDQGVYTETEHFHFSHGPTFNVFMTEPESITADFNKDGKIDLAVVKNLFSGNIVSPTPAGSLFIFRNGGNVDFDLVQTISLPISETVEKVFAVDINNDGLIDLILNTATKIYIYLGSTTGTFSYSGEWDHPKNPWGDPLNTKHAAVADFNGDSLVDISFANSYGDPAFLLGQPGGGFKEHHSSIVNIIRAVSDIFPIDADNDGRMDIAMVVGSPAFRGCNISIIQNGGGDFDVRNVLTYLVGRYAKWGKVGDFDKNGFPDVAVQYEGHVRILLNNSREPIDEKFTLTIASSGGGTTDPSPGTYAYDSGTIVTITATPNTHYNFSGWSGDVSSTDNPLTITMDSDKSITANFESCSRLGDVNGDGDVTPGDAQGAFDIYLQRKIPTDCEEVTSDVNCDGNITPGDAQMIFEHYLGRLELPESCNGSSSTMSNMGLIRQERGQLRIGNARNESGNMITIPVLVSTARGMRSFGMDIRYDPTSMEFIGVRRTELTDIFAAVDANVIADGVVRVGGYGGSASVQQDGVIVELLFKQKSMQRRREVRIIKVEDNISRKIIKR